MLQVVTFITLPSSSYSPSIFTHVRREISKVKKPLPLSKCFLIYQVLHHWMTENRSPIYCKTQQRVSSNRLLSLLPMARVRLEFKRTVSDFKQVDPRCILYIPKYRAKCEQTLASTLENHDIPSVYFRQLISRSACFRLYVFISIPERGESTIEGDRRGLIDR